ALGQIVRGATASQRIAVELPRLERVGGSLVAACRRALASVLALLEDHSMQGRLGCGVSTDAETSSVGVAVDVGSGSTQRAERCDDPRLLVDEKERALVVVAKRDLDAFEQQHAIARLTDQRGTGHQSPHRAIVVERLDVSRAKPPCTR